MSLAQISLLREVSAVSPEQTGLSAASPFIFLLTDPSHKGQLNIS